MGLHTVAVEMALAQTDDKARFDKAAPHVQALLDSRRAAVPGARPPLCRIDRA